MAQGTDELDCYRHYRFQPNSYRMIIKDISLTFVPVGPVIIKSPSLEKKPFESFSAKHSSGFRPKCIARSMVFPSTRAPAASVGPSIPSVLKEATTAPSI